MNRRGFLQALVGVPLAVKAYLSVPALSGPVAEIATGALRRIGPYEWFDFTLEGHVEIQRWASLSGASGHVVVEPPPGRRYSVRAKCYGAHVELERAMQTMVPVTIEVANAGTFEVELERLAVNVPVDDVLHTEIFGWVVG